MLSGAVGFESQFFRAFLGEKQRVRIDAQVCVKNAGCTTSVVSLPQSCERRHKSLGGHHYPPVKSLSLPLNNPVGPQAWRGFSLFLADLASTHPAQILPFPTLSRYLFSTSCERPKPRVRKMTPLQIKGLPNFPDRQFFRALLGQTVVRKKREDESLRALGQTASKTAQGPCVWIAEKVPGFASKTALFLSK